MNTNEFNERFGKRLTYYLERNGMMQKDLCDILNVSKTTVSNWCKGAKAPRMNKIDEICKFLGITRTHLMGSDEEVAKLEGNLDEDKMLTKFNNLSAEQQKQLINYADFLLQQQKDK
jgi:transcriptional regulator with XRE-family HTH domain